MGIRQDALERLEKNLNLISEPNGRSMLELGCQNIYAPNFEEGFIAQDYWLQLGIEITTWDILACQKAIKMDLRNFIPVEKQYDIVTNYGTLEHIEGKANDLYTAFLNVHNHCKDDGIMIHELPLIDHWPNNEGHWGYHWFSLEWAKLFAEYCKYEVIDSGIQYAMHNYETGGLVHCTWKKTTNEFISYAAFENFYKKLMTHE